ncbi:hypothetical protein [Ferrovibrio sp.]|uniref:hypothetical protein n=1 Tax=Ferrovibrio sp. TaxID=1917215 RepID=UPI0025C5BACC|nr:hypothetical protein [Ferrovibrio sp.]MBX3453418.1 hypothetical protein [Ferrovibrio sp.]
MFKFLLLIAVIAGAYYGYRYLNRREAEKAAEKLRRESQQASGQDMASRAPVAQKPAQPASEDMVACPACGTYRPASAPACDTPGCSANKAA